MEYAKLVAPLIEAVKTLKSRNEELKAGKEALKRENQAMQQTLQEILARLDALEK